MTDMIKQVFQTPDGQKFDTKQDAVDHMRLPKIKAALTKLAKGNNELVNWLVEKQETVESAFEVGTIQRVTKSERNKLQKALEAIAEVGNSKFAFVTENAGAILDSFRWPKVNRMNEEAKAFATRNSLILAGNEEVADWVIANKDAILEAYKAGVEKREVSTKAVEALAAYRAKKAIEKFASDNNVSSEEAAVSDEITSKHSADAIEAALNPAPVAQ